MGELSINEKRKIIRREFKQFNQENGFRFVRPNTLLREQNDILQRNRREMDAAGGQENR